MVHNYRSRPKTTSNILGAANVAFFKFLSGSAEENLVDFVEVKLNGALRFNRSIYGNWKGPIKNAPCIYYQD